MISIRSRLLLVRIPVKINDMGLDKSFDESDLTSIPLYPHRVKLKFQGQIHSYPFLALRAKAPSVYKKLSIKIYKHVHPISISEARKNKSREQMTVNVLIWRKGMRRRAKRKRKKRGENRYIKECSRKSAPYLDLTLASVLLAPKTYILNP